MLCGRVEVGKFGNIQVEVAMIQAVGHLVFNQVRKNLEVDDIPGFGIHRTGYLNLHFVIMPMVIGQGAFTKNFPVPGLVPVGTVQSMGGVEMGYPAHGDFHDK